MKQVSVTYLKKNLKSILIDVKKGRSFVITNRGKAVAEINPIHQRRRDAIKKLKELRNTAIIGDLLSPLNEPWHAH